MAAQGTRKRFALDSNVLMDLAGEEDYAHTFREEFQQRGLPPTVAHELLHASATKSDPDATLPPWLGHGCPRYDGEGQDRIKKSKIIY